MASIPPIVRHMLVCDDVDRGPALRPKLDVLGMVHTIRAKPGLPFPLHHPGLCVYLVLTGGAGSGVVRIRVVEADSGIEAFGSPAHRISYPPDRHEVAGVLFRITDCVIPRPGLYWVEFLHDGNVVQPEPIIVRET